MAVAWLKSQAKLVVNKSSTKNHVSNLLALIRTAESFDCMSAFASESGLKLISPALRTRVENGLSTRFVLGLDFYQTDPKVLNALLTLSEEYEVLKLYMGDAESGTVFHPKVYSFLDQDEHSYVVVGSANLTQGGLSGNHEMSALITAEGPELASNVSVEINRLIKLQEVVPATRDLIDQYAAKHSEYAFHLALARKRAKLAKPSNVVSMDKLKVILDLMKLKESEDDPNMSLFDAQSQRRMRDRRQARNQLDGIASANKLTKTAFLALYEPLVVGHLWHSGSLHRHRDEVADNAGVFREALQLVQGLLKVNPKIAPDDIFEPLLTLFKRVPQAGINIMTEVLHTYDCDRFAIMNQNSVSGLQRANITGFPLHPSKRTVSAEKYALYCVKCREVCDALSLKNFAELDALLNYAFWNEPG
jgi:HKD family nuclease